MLLAISRQKIGWSLDLAQYLSPTGASNCGWWMCHWSRSDDFKYVTVTWLALKLRFLWSIASALHCAVMHRQSSYFWYLDSKLVGGFKCFLVFTLGNHPTWRAYFSNGWFKHQLSANNNSSLLVWGLVVWIPRIPENERECCLGVPLESQTTGPQSTNLQEGAPPVIR